MQSKGSTPKIKYLFIFLKPSLSFKSLYLYFKIFKSNIFRIVGTMQFLIPCLSHSPHPPHTHKGACPVTPYNRRGNQGNLRETALEKILPYQQKDFEELYETLEGFPVTIRFLDPPLHEFVPTEEADIKKLADAQGKSVEQIKAIISSLHEFNPMMGHRGCRLDVTYPEIAKMQTRAVIRAAIATKKNHPDWDIKPEIMIPLVCEVKELKFVKDIVVKTADEEIAASDIKLEYEVGTMIEIPRAALTADEIAKEADFFCFGTNDLTQMTFGFSRDDAGKFLDAYYDAKIFENDPFAKLDQTGVGKLMETAIKLGKPANPNLHMGICGEHGGDSASVEFCHNIGLDYVSCSPFRVPIARLAAAQAAIKANQKQDV